MTKKQIEALQLNGFDSKFIQKAQDFFKINPLPTGTKKNQFIQYCNDNEYLIRCYI